MADNFDAKAVISAQIDGIKSVLDDLAKLESGIGSVTDISNKLNGIGKNLAGFTGGLKEAGSAAQQAGKGLKGAAADADDYAAALRKVQDATRQAAVGEVRGSVGDISPKAVQSMSASERQNYIKAYDAQNTSAISLARSLEAANSQTASLAAAQDALAAKSSPRLRYALYDVATTAGITATALLGVGTAVGIAGASFESSFTNVERTLENGMGADKVSALREELIGLTRDMPLAFSEITDIATLGNQLGIAGDDVSAFTETVAKFSAVTGITAEAAATAFGSLGELLNVPVSQFENLGSSIAYVGRTSVATESEIVAMSTRLAASATNAGFTAQQVIALSGAFASLRIAPERAQGVMEVYFKQLNGAIANGGDKLAAFGRFAGVAAEDVEGLVRADPNAFFQRLATGLGKLDQIAQTRALDQLGLDGIRAGEVFGRVSANVDVFNKALQDSDSSWAAGTELASQYAKVLDDLTTRWTILMNAIAELGAAAGAALAPMLADLIEGLTQVIQGFSDFVATDFGADLVRNAAFIGALVAALAGIVTVAALAGGSLLAMRLAAIELGIVSAGATTGVSGLVASLLGLRGAATVAAASSTAAAGSVAVLGGSAAKTSGALATAGRAAGGLVKGLAGLAIIGELIGWVTDFDGKIRQVSGSLSVSSKAWSNFAQNGIVSIEMLHSPLGALIGLITTVASALAGFDINGGMARGFDRIAAGGKKSSKGMASLKTAGEALKFDDWTLDAGDFASGLDDVGGAASDAAKKVTTLADYAGDLAGVFSRAFDIRFGGQQGLDTITSGWQSIATAADQAREAAEEHRRTLATMGADRAVKQYWLSVAENYGDELRAAKLRAELAELDADMAKEKKDLTKAQDASSMSLEGNSAAAIANRASLLGLVGNYQDYLKALAASGASQETLASESQRLRGEFTKQAASLGFGRTEIAKYAEAFDGMTAIINAVPRNITVDFNADPALLALNEFFAQLEADAAAGGSGAGGAGGGGFNDGFSTKVLGAGRPAVGRSLEMALANAGMTATPVASGVGGGVGGGLSKAFGDKVHGDMNNIDIIQTGWVAGQSDLGLTAGTGIGGKTAGGVKAGLGSLNSGYNPIGAFVNRNNNSAWNNGNAIGTNIGNGITAGLGRAIGGRSVSLKSGKLNLNHDGYASGGYTGDGGTNQVAGVVHGKEFVMSAPAVKNAGGPNAMAYMHSMLKAGKGFGPVGVGANAGGVVDLSARSISQLAQAIIAANPSLVLPGAALAGSVGAANTFNNRRGNG